MADLHPSLEHIAFLVGTWHGLGVMGYPDVEESQFEQRITFSHDGRSFLSYRSDTWLLDDAGERIRPAAGETGFWRPGAGDRELEVLIVHPTGLLELSVGEVAFTKIELVSDLLARTQTAKEVTAISRLYGMVDGDLAYAVDMAAVGKPLQAHLSAKLQRES